MTAITAISALVQLDQAFSRQLLILTSVLTCHAHLILYARPRYDWEL
jgi:hypothetical protein